MSGQQRSLFDTIGGQGAYVRARDINPPRAATADPATSHEAADRIAPTADQQAARVADWVRRHPGKTSRELAAVVTDRDLDRHAIARRLPEAEERGLVRRGEARACDVGRGRALTWWPTEQG